MNHWQIYSFVGLGSLRFGMSRHEIRENMSEDPVEFEKVPGVRCDAYDGLGMHLYFDTNDKLEFIEAFPPCRVEFRGVQLLEQRLITLLPTLDPSGSMHRYDDQGYFFDDWGFVLFSEEDSVDGVSVFPHGYYGD